MAKDRFAYVAGVVGLAALVLVALDGVWHLAPKDLVLATKDKTTVPHSFTLQLASKVPELTITGITLNRGSCIYQGPTSIRLKFGETWQGIIPCDPIEIFIASEQGNQTLIWKSLLDP
jgi:hypothetical protein